MMKRVVDQLNRAVVTKVDVPRIVSLVPSQTELLFDLGLGDEVVGITKFCIHPKEWFTSKSKVGGTKNVNIEKIKSLNPNLILANKEENTLSDIEKLESIAPVWISDVRTIAAAHDMILKIGALVDKSEKAIELSNKIQKTMTSIVKPEKKYSVLYVIWNEPIMVAANDTFINAMLEYLGYTNAAAHLNRYPAMTEHEIIKLNPDFIFLSSEPYPFKEKHLTNFQKSFPKSKTILVDGELFSWYGSRLLRTKSLETLLDFQH